MPSFIHAALSGVRRANRPREIAENFILALSHARKPVGLVGTGGVMCLSESAKFPKSHAGSFRWTVTRSRRKDLGPPRPALFGMTGMEKAPWSPQPNGPGPNHFVLFFLLSYFFLFFFFLLSNT